MVAGVRVRQLPIYDKQADFRKSPAWLRGFCAGRGAGKTFIGALDMLLRARNGHPCMIVSPSYVVLEDTTWPTFRETAEMLDVYIKGVKSPIPRIQFRTQDGGEAEVVFRSGENPDSLRGPSKAMLWLDEASIMHEDVYKWGAPVLRHRGKMGSLSMTFTPRGRRHWTFGVFFEQCSEEEAETEVSGTYYKSRHNTHLIRSHTLDNPFLPEEYYANIASQYTTALAAQELAGEFVDLQGLMFRREWFRLVDNVPQQADRIRYWDKAASIDKGAYSAGVLLARTDAGEVFIEDVVRGQWSYLDRNKIMLDTAEEDARKYGNSVRIYFEQEPGSGGKESAQQTIRLLAKFPAYRDVISGQAHRMKDKVKVAGSAKVIRAQPFAAQAEAGNVCVKRGNWTSDYLEELSAFPEYQFMDQVDATSGAYNQIVKHATEYSGPAEKSEPPAIEPLRHGVRFTRQPRGRFRR